MSLLAQNIERYRLKRKLTQEDLAEKLSVSPQTVSDWETGIACPNIDTLVKIAYVLNADTTTLIFGSQELYQQEKKRFVIALGILLILVAFTFFFTPIAIRLLKTEYIALPLMLLKLYILPTVWLVAGWTFMQGLGVLALVKPSTSKYRKAIRITSVSIIVFFIVIMFPYMMTAINNTIAQIQFLNNPSLYPGGFENIYNIPAFIFNIERVLMNVVYKHPEIFVIPSIIIWLTRSPKDLR